MMKLPIDTADVAILGGGPGGYVAALRAAQPRRQFGEARDHH